MMQPTRMTLIPRVSVIIPTYNCDRFIVQAVESVLAQTFDDYEIIVIDDGSTDQTRQVLQPYAEHIRYVYQSNQGASVARNQGLDLAQGELVAFLDADDYFLPEKLAEQVACFDAQPTVDLVQSGWRVVTQQGEAISDVEMWTYAPQLDLKTLVLYKICRPSGMMLKREWCDRVGGFDPQFPVTQDLDFLLRLVLLGCQAVWLKKIHVCYRQHPSSLMASGSKLVQDTEAAMEHFFAKPELPLQIRQLKNQERYQCFVWLACRMYFDGYGEEMQRCLYKSLEYTSLAPTEVLLNWLQIFRAVATEYGYQFNSYSLVNSNEWQALMKSVFQSNSKYAPAALSSAS